MLELVDRINLRFIDYGHERSSRFSDKVFNYDFPKEKQSTMYYNNILANSITNCSFFSHFLLKYADKMQGNIRKGDIV